MFGGGSTTHPTSGVSDLLLGAGSGNGGFGSSSSLGNGFGNVSAAASDSAAATSGVAAPTAAAATGGSSSGIATSTATAPSITISSSTTTNTSNAFDLSDFPSLGGGVGGGVGSNSSSGIGGLFTAADGTNTNHSNGLAAALRQQQHQQLLAHQQMLQGSAAQKQQQHHHQQQQLQQQQNNLYRLAMQGANGENFNMASEDFPALPGALLSSSSTGLGSGNGNTGSTTNTASRSSLLMMGGGAGSAGSGGGNTLINHSHGGFGLTPTRLTTTSTGGSNGGGGLYGNDLDASSRTARQLEGAGLLGGAALDGLTVGGLGGLQKTTTTTSSASSAPLNMSSSRTTTTTTHSAAGTSSGLGLTGGGGAGGGNTGSATGTALSGDYGLLGLLGVIRMTDADRNALALGSDLTMLGLNLGSSEHIYNTFSGPWSDGSANPKEPHYQLPMCYYMQPPALKTGHLSKFQLETLFYIFYALPKDVLQAYAGQELYTREWRYHGDLKLWFKRANPSDGIATSSNANTTTTSSTTASPQYLYFDINTWERRLFNGNMNQNVTSGFLSDEDVRVKFPSS